MPGWFNGDGGVGLGQSRGRGAHGRAESVRVSPCVHPSLYARFFAYEGCLNGLRDCVPVRSHNRQHGTAVRQHVR